LATADVQELAHWCRSLVRARVIAIDAPSRWSSDGRARPCERELMQKGIWCFSSPTHQKAHTPHRTGTFDWMLQGGPGSGHRPRIAVVPVGALGL
jgi:hypothetical protein